MRIYRTPAGWELETDDARRLALPQDATPLTTREDLHDYLRRIAAGSGAAIAGPAPACWRPSNGRRSGPPA